jgi:hypothetical protein
MSNFIKRGIFATIVATGTFLWYNKYAKSKISSCEPIENTIVKPTKHIPRFPDKSVSIIEMDGTNNDMYEFSYCGDQPVIIKSSYNSVVIQYMNNILNFSNGKKQDDTINTTGVVLHPEGVDVYHIGIGYDDFGRSYSVIMQKDIDNIINKKCDHIILSNGYGNIDYTGEGNVYFSDYKVPNINICEECPSKISIGTKNIYIMKSNRAVIKYNELVQQNFKVGMLLCLTD